MSQNSPICAVFGASALTALLILLIVPKATLAQSPNTEHTLKLDSGAKPAAAELQQFEWLVGRWEGTGLDGQCEEVFLPVWNDTMFGSFRYVNEGKLVFSEFFSLVKTDEGVILKLKHFQPDMTGWEEKDKMVNFPLVKVEKHAAYFSGLTYQLDEQGDLRVWVAMRNRAGELGEAEFKFRRAPMSDETAAAVSDKPIAEQLLERLQKTGFADKPFTLVATLKVKPDQIEAMLAAARKCMALSQAEPGCLMYEFQHDLENPTTFLVFEKWKNSAALLEHINTPHFAELGTKLQNVLDGSPTVQFFAAVPK